MASRKQFSFIIALIFGFILASSFANAARTIDALVPQDDWSCQFLSDVPSCTNDKECADQCERHKFHKGGSCLVIPFVPDQTSHCCCYN
ncbi:hypothetical protein MKX03_000155 [Papaver bracteatum]|nr:hypothetical protein MKX03_000155 [Papaver bracteatum]